MQVCASPSAQHHDLKRLVPQPSQLLDDAVLTWPLQPWPVHAKRGRKRRHAVYAGELDGQFPMCTPALPLFVGGDGDGQDVGPVQAVFSPESLHEGAAKVCRQESKDLLWCLTVNGFDRTCVDDGSESLICECVVGL